MKLSVKNRSDPLREKFTKAGESVIKLLISTPVNINLLEKLLLNHPDKQMVDYLLNGFDTGIKTLPTKTYECKNPLSATTQPNVTAQLVQTKLEKGFISDPYSYVSMPFEL